MAHVAPLFACLLGAVCLLAPAPGVAAPTTQAAPGNNAESAYGEGERLLAHARIQQASTDATVRTQSSATYRAAHTAFAAVLKRDPDGPWAIDAVRGQLLALRGALLYEEASGWSRVCNTNSEGGCIGRAPRLRGPTAHADATSGLQVTAYAPAEAALLRAYDLYQVRVPDPQDSLRASIEYHRCRLMVAHNRFADALPRLHALVTEFDGSLHAAWAAEILTDVLTIQWTDSANSSDETLAAADALESWARTLQSLKTYRHEQSDRLREAVPALLAGVAWARAETYRAQGAAGDPTGFARCGEQYTAVLNEFSGHDRADDLLFNAARCFEAANLLSRAMALRSTLVSRHGGSALHMQTLRDLAENYQSITMFDQAANHLERFAELYPKDKYTPTALSNAYVIRTGLADATRATANLERYELLYQKTRPAEVASFFWARHAYLKSDAQKLAHAERYLKMYGSRGGIDRRIVAEATIGQILWRQSCRRTLVHDSCVSVKRQAAVPPNDLRRARPGQRAIPRYCGEVAGDAMTVHARDRRKADAAQKRFATVLRLAQEKPEVPTAGMEDWGRLEAYRNALGMSMVYAADREYEAYLALKIPKGLEFYVDPRHENATEPRRQRGHAKQLAKRAESERSFAQFFQRKARQGRALIGRYAEVRATASPHWVLAAAARTAVVAGDVSVQLHHTPVPRSIGTTREYEAYCEALGEATASPRTMARAAYTHCLDQSTVLGYFDEFSQVCEQALRTIDPKRYPAMHEILGTASHTRSVMDVVGVQTDPAPPPGVVD